MEKQLLREQEIFPSEEVLKNVLGGVYEVLDALKTRLMNEEALVFDWYYYSDGKSWLCKVCHKKKTVFWLSVWDGYFKTTFFFLERHLESIAALEIAEPIKEDFYRIKPVGKLIPMIVTIHLYEQIDDIVKIVKFKKSAK